MQDQTTAERAYLRVSVANEVDRLNKDRGPENAPFGGWRNEAINRIATRESMNPYTLDRIIREDEPSEPVYPERFGTMTAVMLDDSTLETIRAGLQDSASLWIDELRGLEAELAMVELWAIDRACRVLGIDS